MISSVRFYKDVESPYHKIVVSVNCGCQVVLAFESKVDRIYFATVEKVVRCKGHKNLQKGKVFETQIIKCLSGKMFNEDIIDASRSYLHEKTRLASLQISIIKYLNDHKINESVMKATQENDRQLHELTELLDKMSGNV